MAVSPHCKALVEKAAAYHPLYGDRLANHLPMTLVALDRMGADAARLDFFYRSYVGYLTLAKPATVSPGFDALAHLGDEGRYPDYLVFFESAISGQGHDAVLREWVPRLTPGLAASAFHALIRLAYAVDARIDSEIPRALAYWASSYQPLGEPATVSDETLPQIAARLAPLGKQRRPEAGLIIDRVREIGAMPGFQQAVKQPRRLTLDLVRDFCLDAYQEVNHFTLLHTLTGTHAFRLLLPYQSDAELALRHHWQAILAALLSTGLVLQGAPHRASIALPNWHAWLNRTTSIVDSHRIKLIYTCWQEFTACDDLRYAEIAGQAQRG